MFATEKTEFVLFDLATFSDTYSIPKLSGSWYQPNLPSTFLSLLVFPAALVA